MNIPTSLTWLRIFAIPFVAIFYYLPFKWAHPVAALLFVLAGLTDWLDGYLARRFSQMTDLGAFLDPVADKLLVAVVLILIVAQHLLPYLEIPAAIIVGREIVISALREWMAEIGKRTSVAVSYIGKIKTVLQMSSLVLLIWYHPDGVRWILWSGATLLVIAAMLTLWSMLVYLKLAWPDLTLSKDQ